MSRTVWITKGLPASGKSTWAKAKVRASGGQIKRISKDDLRAMLDGSEFSKKREATIITVRDTLMLHLLTSGYDVIVDDTNLNHIHEERIRDLTRGLAVVVIQDFTDVPLEECIRRDQQRANYVGERVIRRMYRDYLAPKQGTVTKPIYDPRLPYAIIVDMDGTLALRSDRSPYDWLRVGEDKVNEAIAEIVWLNSQAYEVIIVSGRSDICRPQTEEWLKFNGLRFDHLFMRQEGDNRKDAIVKREIYDREIAGKFNVKFVLDDRNQVVEMWRSLGLTCLQVAEGDF